ncbi:FimV/HubP family polar landmark protein [Undibacterium sp. Di24W]|uniref:FimV/HubP family polar landmark protein n=1 Tax=Undibacterium sp. Di24W TaxID=3413033 RepID=UPI003BF44217
MHNYKRLPMSFLSSKVLKAAAFSSLLVFSNAYATGLGKLTVLSSLGQPLRAEIELTSPNKEEIASLVPKVASIEAFRQANIEFNPALLSLRFAVEQRGSNYIIRVTSTQAMNEPWIDFLLEMNASNGKLLREYTFLLDPAELTSGQAVQVVNPGSTIASSKPVSNLQPAKAELLQKDPVAGVRLGTKKNAQTVVASTNLSNASARQYQVKPGDTLMKIAANNLNGVSLDEMLVSIYRTNPEAFVGDNMNRLKAGQILNIPDADTVRSNAVPNARSVVQAHSADFNAYRNKIAGQVLSVPAERAVQKKQAASGSITTKVKETPTATNESLDKLKLSKVQAGGKNTAAPAKGMTEEDKIAKDKALSEANARVKELEKNVSELNKLLAVPSKNVVKQPASESKAVEAKPAAPETKAPAPVVAPASVASAAASAASLDKPKTAAVEPSASASASSVTASAKVESASASAVASKPKRPMPPPPPPVVEETSWFDTKYLIAAGLLAALGGAIGLYASKKKKVSHQFEDSILTGSSLKANSMFGSTGGQSVDTNNSVFNSNFAPSASQLDANEVDPVAEADVYIAYGRDSQAEDILKEALRTQPDRHAVRLKLLEIYFGRKDIRSFELYSGELYGMTRGEGEDWAQAASMGISLDPNNPLYAGATAQVEAYAASSLGLPTQPLEDIESDALLDNSLSEDMLDSISIIDTAHALSDDGFGAADKSKSDLDLSSSFADDGGLDFDLGISTDSAPEVPSIEDAFPLTLPESPVSEIKVHEEEQIPTIDFGSIDFDLGGDEVAAKPLESESDKGIASDSFGLELDMPKSVELDQAQENVLGKAEESFDLGSLDFDMGDESVSASAVTDSASVGNNQDLLSLDQELGNNTAEDSGDAAALEDSSPYNAEMATKLDLAVAYQEIGDKEGARELLEEVIKGGSNEQVERAKQMLDALA